MVGKQIGQAFSENVIQPVVAETKNVAQATMEQISGTNANPQDPALAQTKRLDEEKRRNWALKVIDWYKKLQEEQMKVRSANQQQEQARLQGQQQTQQVKQFEQLEQQKKSQQIADLDRKKRGTELRGGVGG